MGFLFLIQKLKCYQNAVHHIQIHQAMNSYLYMYKNILAPELFFFNSDTEGIKTSKRQSNSVKNRVSQQPQTYP